MVASKVDVNPSSPVPSTQQAHSIFATGVTATGVGTSAVPDIDLGAAAINTGCNLRSAKKLIPTVVRKARWLALSAALPVACVSLHSALAENSPDDRVFDKRFYIGGGVGLSRLEPGAYCPCMTISDSTDKAFNLFAGVDISRRFSVEGYYSDLGAAGVDFLGQGVGEIDYSVLGVSGLFYFINHQDPASDWDDEGFYSREGVSIYLRFGAGVMQNDSALDFEKDHSGHFSAGMGIEYGFRNGFGLRLEANAYDTDAKQVNFSVLKRFGTTEPYMAATVPVAPTPEPLPRLSIPTPPEESSVPAIELPIVYFEFGRFELTRETRERLDAVIEEVLDVESDLALRLSGHTDEIDTPDFNQRLSVNRANAVRDYLTARNIANDRLETEGFGETQPIADNNTEQGRALNRRVEISFR